MIILMVIAMKAISQRVSLLTRGVRRSRVEVWIRRNASSVATRTMFVVFMFIFLSLRCEFSGWGSPTR